VDSRGRFIRQSQLSAVLLFSPLGAARFEHQLECANLLVRDGERAPRNFGFFTDRLQLLFLDQYLHLAPVEQSLEVTQQSHGQRDAGRRALRGIDLHEHHAHSRLCFGNQARMLLHDALVLR
jgi:hypothetical protein